MVLTIKTSAPGKIILFGEHAVVYDKLGIATTVDKTVNVTITENKDNVKIISKNLLLKETLSKEKLFEFFDGFEKIKNNFDIIKEFGKNKLSPIIFIVSKFMKKFGFYPLTITIDSDIPKNLGSSSAVFSATALALSSFTENYLSKQEIADFAYDGDKIAHGGLPSGIDSTVVTYGGYVKYKKQSGFEKLNVNFTIPMIIIDSGEPSLTGVTVPYINKLKNERQIIVNEILEKLDCISHNGLEAINSQNLERIGNLMTDYYNELRRLNISTKNLDNIIDIALKNNALGAKPTGGWGGGCCIVLTKNQKQASNLIKIYKDNNFNAFQAKIGVKGVNIGRK